VCWFLKPETEKQIGPTKIDTFIVIGYTRRQNAAKKKEPTT
jgi:hypothetical protein